MDSSAFNHTVLSAFNIDSYYDSICNSLKSMRKARMTAKDKSEVNETSKVGNIKYDASLSKEYSIAAEP